MWLCPPPFSFLSIGAIFGWYACAILVDNVGGFFITNLFSSFFFAWLVLVFIVSTAVSQEHDGAKDLEPFGRVYGSFG